MTTRTWLCGLALLGVAGLAVQADSTQAAHKLAGGGATVRAAALQSGAPQAEEGFISLFDGKTLDGWHGLPGYWSVKDGAITGSETKENSKQTFLVLDKPYANFELHYKYKYGSDEGNSGVQFRSKVINPATSRVGGYQADNDAHRQYDGSIYDEAGVAGGRGTMSNRGERTVWDENNQRHSTPLRTSNQRLQNDIKEKGWNDVVLVADGPHVTYSINGHLMTDLTDNSPKALHDGVIALQLHQGFTMEVQYKDIEIKKLGNPQ